MLYALHLRCRLALCSAIVALAMGNAATAQRLLRSWAGEMTDAKFGSDCADLGDVDGDGIHDLAIGAPEQDIAAGAEAGRLYVYSGASGALLWSKDGPDKSNWFSYAISEVGDLNADNVMDVVVGTANRNYVQVLSGADGSLIHFIHGDANTGNLGNQVAGLGDLNHDGIADLVVAAPGANYNGTSSGSIFLYSGADAQLLQRLDGSSPDVLLGFRVSSASDLNQDGFCDLLAMDLGRRGPDYGTVWVYSGQDRSVLFGLSGEKSGDLFGFGMARVGDLDFDGVTELVIGAIEWNASCPTEEGYAKVSSGKDGSLRKRFEGLADRDEFGVGISGVGDVNRDGAPDFLVGAFQPECDPLPAGSGYSFLYSGRTLQALYQFVGREDNIDFGFSSTGLGDVNADGFSDYVITALCFDACRGEVYLYSGNDLFLNATPKSLAPNETVTLTIAEAPLSSPVALFLVALDGAPNVGVLAVGVMDANERLALSLTVPAGLSGHTASLRAYALVNRSMLDTADETLTFR